MKIAIPSHNQPLPSSERPELLRLIPPSARRILDIGCGTGEMGAALKRERPGVHVTGIEILSERAARAEKLLDGVILGDATLIQHPSDEAPYDCIVYGDSIEHVVDPKGLLLRHKGWLAEGGSVVGSVPNIQHHSIVRMLLSGRWDQTDYGLCDRTHLRFFTRRSLLQLLDDCGYRIDLFERGQSTAGRFCSLGLPPLADFFTYQYRFRARAR